MTINARKYVGDLKKAIKNDNEEITCPACKLELFLAKNINGMWFASDTDYVKKLKKPLKLI
jgi:hypothetical protein